MIKDKKIKILIIKTHNKINFNNKKKKECYKLLEIVLKNQLIILKIHAYNILVSILIN